MASTKLASEKELTREVDTSRPAIAAGLPDEALQEVNRLWTIVRAFSNTAHDVNNALQVITGSAELLEARDLEPTLRRRIETIRIQAGRAAAIIERLLLYAREAPETCGTFDLAPLLESAVAMRACALNRARIGISIERSDSEPYWIAGDRNRTLQALLNVLLSAEETVKGRDARIGVRLDRQAQAVALSVTAAAGAEANVAQVAPATRRASSVAAVTTDAEIWAAVHLVTAQRGTVHVRRTELGVTLTLSFPAAQQPA
jgi:signal transduction histidine kinase